MWRRATKGLHIMTGPQAIPAGFEGYELIGSIQLGQILGRSPKSIQIDASRRPESLPPRFVIPGCRLVRWRKKDVIEWMDALAKIEQDKRRNESDLDRRLPASGYIGSKLRRR